MIAGEFVGPMGGQWMVACLVAEDMVPLVGAVLFLMVIWWPEEPVRCR